MQAKRNFNLLERLNSVIKTTAKPVELHFERSTGYKGHFIVLCLRSTISLLGLQWSTQDPTESCRTSGPAVGTLNPPRSCTPLSALENPAERAVRLVSQLQPSRATRKRRTMKTQQYDPQSQLFFCLGVRQTCKSSSTPWITALAMYGLKCIASFDATRRLFRTPALSSSTNCPISPNHANKVLASRVRARVSFHKLPTASTELFARVAHAPVCPARLLRVRVLTIVHRHKHHLGVGHA